MQIFYRDEKHLALNRGNMNQQILVPDIGDYTGVEVIDVVAKIGNNLAKEIPLLL